jgi:type VI secretion system protein ImpF
MLHDMPGLFDRLTSGDRAQGRPPSSPHALELLKDAIGRDLEALLNTRKAMDDAAFDHLPHVCRSVLNYGLLDFAGLCLSSETDRLRICTAVRLAIQRHEPRLCNVSACLSTSPQSTNRVALCIAAHLRVRASGGEVLFHAVLEQSSQRYSIRRDGRGA